VVATSTNALLKDAAYKLVLRSRAVRLFTAAGEEITGTPMGEIPEGWGLVVSEGEGFCKRVEF